MRQRRIGKSDIKISPLGMGCWAIGGEFYDSDGHPVGWGKTNDAESLKALQTAYEHGITFYDTADIYGTGHSERLIGQAFADKRDKVVIATKFGNVLDEKKKRATGQEAKPEYIRSACENSLKRLNTDYIDLYQFHLNEYDPQKTIDIIDTLEELVFYGKIRAYGWSTDYIESAKAFIKGKNNSAVQFQMNVLDNAKPMVKLCEENRLAAINRSPLAMGILTGKYDTNSRLPKDDVRGEKSPEWMKYFKKGKPVKEALDKCAAVNDILTSNGRTLVQGAIAWLWGCSFNTIPIPGIRTVTQAKENANAMNFDALTPAQMREIDNILA